MSHHGWVPVVDRETLTPAGLKSPFGRLFPASNHQYNSHMVSMLSGALGPLQGSTASTGKPSNPAGFTFLGQFIDHDLTEFRVLDKDYSVILQNPTIGQRQRVLEDNRLSGEFPTCTNGRTGLLDLDSVYGVLGQAQSNLYDANGYFRLAPGKRDILRGTEFNDQRLIGDLRNDENKIVVQLHILFERLHNVLHAQHNTTGNAMWPGGDLFLKTKAKVWQIYHNIILCDYLPKIVQPAQLKQVANVLKQGTTCFQQMTVRSRKALDLLGVDPVLINHSVAIPVEFSHAAFRLGHSQLLNAYILNINSATARIPLFTTRTEHKLDLRGRSKLDFNTYIDWNYFFATGVGLQQSGDGIDGLLPAAVFRLPPPTIGEPPVSLAERNIRRGIDFGLPTGQEALAILTDTYGGIKGMLSEDLFPKPLQEVFDEILEGEPSFAWHTPLWYYIIKEAEVLAPGSTHLGPVGGYIVAETILGIFDAMSKMPRFLALKSITGYDMTDILDNVIQDEYPQNPSSGAPDNPLDICTMAQLVNFLNREDPLDPGDFDKKEEDPCSGKS